MGMIASETHVSNLLSAVGCDSTITTNLTVITVNSSVAQSGDTLFATAPPAAGQEFLWMLCGPPFTPLLEATEPFYVPVVNGLYAVAVSLHGCADTSGCYTVSNVGLEEQADALVQRLYPNPTRHAITVELAASAAHAQLSMLDVSGRSLLTVAANGQQRVVVPLERLAAGVYLLGISSGTVQRYYRVVVE